MLRWSGVRGTIYSVWHNTGRLKQAHEPSSGLLWSTHHFSWMLPHRGVYPLPGSVCLTPAEPWGGRELNLSQCHWQKSQWHIICASHILFLLGLWGEVFGLLLSCQRRLSCSLCSSFCQGSRWSFTYNRSENWSTCLTRFIHLNSNIQALSRHLNPQISSLYDHIYIYYKCICVKSTESLCPIISVIVTLFYQLFKWPLTVCFHQDYLVTIRTSAGDNTQI